MIFKNVADQGVYLFAFDTAADAPKTGDAANITGTQSLNGATPGTAFDETNPDEIGGGLYWQPLSQAETNGNAFAYRWVSGTANVVIEPVVGFTEAGRILGTLAAGTHTAQTGNVFGELPANFADLAITDTTGIVTASGNWSTHSAADVLSEFGTGAALTSLTTATGFAVPGDAMTLDAAYDAAKSAAPADEYDTEMAALQAGIDALAIDTGSGPIEVAVTVEDADEAPLQGATVRLTEGATSLMATTQADGTRAFGMTAATWRAVVVKAGYQHEPEDVEVTAATEALTLTMTAVAITPPAAARQVTCYGLTLDAQGALEPEIDVTFELIRPTQAGIYSRVIVEATSAAVTAVVEVALPREAEFKFRRTGGTTAWKRFITPDADTFELPPI